MMSEVDMVNADATPKIISAQDDLPQEAIATNILTQGSHANTAVTVATPSSTPSTPRKARKQKAKASSSPPETTDMASLPLLICSVGNPGAAYANTLHSAGHNVVQAMAALLQTSSFSKDRNYGNGSLTRSYSPETPWTLWQSPTFMNESGKGVSAAYKAWNRENMANAGRLVVVHDELEKPLGSITVRDKEGLSARGHNGIKSCLASLGPVKFVRIGVGIGRPVSRDSDDVARYVLKKMTPAERMKIEGAAEEVLNKLFKIKG